MLVELLLVQLCVFAGKQLKVYSITAGRRKTLPENCIGHFSTTPEVCVCVCTVTGMQQPYIYALCIIILGLSYCCFHHLDSL